MKKLARLAFSTDKVDVSVIEELPMAMKYGTETQYQPIIDQARNRLSEIRQAAAEGSSIYPQFKELEELSESQLESLRSISEIDQESASRLSRQIASNIKMAGNTVRRVVRNNQKEFASSSLAEALLREAFEKITCAKTNREVLDLGKNSEARLITNAVVKIAAKMAGINDYAIKEGNVLRERMQGDDIKFANLVIGNLSSKINGSVIPSAKKVGMLEAAKLEIEQIASDDISSVELSDTEFCKDLLSKDYSEAERQAEAYKEGCDKIISVMKLTSLPRDMLYNHNSEYNKEAISSLNAISNQMLLVDNRATHLKRIQDDLGDIFSQYELGSVPLNQKVFDPQETDWFLKYTDEGTEAYNALKDLAESVEGDQNDLEEALGHIEILANQHLPNEVKYVHEGIRKEIKLHRDAIKSNDYSM